MKALLARSGALWTLIVVLVVAVPLTFSSWFSAGPCGKHAWAQADHMAIALQFAVHPNFFVPHSYNLAPDFMGEEQTDFTTGITRADFPLAHWVSGQILSATSSKSAAPVRWTFYLLSIVGLLLWAQFLLKASRRSWLWLLVIAGLFAGPLWIYFATAMMPSTVALSALLAATVAFERFRLTPTAKWLTITTLLLALAALMRPPFAVFGVGFAVWLLLNGHGRKVQTWLIPGLIFAVCVAYTLHSIGLGEKHGSLFLSNVDWGLTPSEMVSRWWQGCSSHIRLLLLVICPALAGLLLATKKGLFTAKDWMAGGAVLGLSLTYQYLVAPQFVHHDYYLLDTWVPLCLMAVHFSRDVWQGKRLVVLAVATPLLAFVAWNTHGGSYSREVSVQYVLDRGQASFLHSAGLLDELGIPKEAKVLVLDAYSTNLPLIALDRMGFLVDHASESKVQGALHYDWDVIVLPRESLDAPWALASLDPTELHCMGSNGLVSVYRKRESEEGVQNHWEFSGDGFFSFEGSEVKHGPYRGNEEFPMSALLTEKQEGFAMHLHASGSVFQTSERLQCVVKSQFGYQAWDLAQGAGPFDFRSYLPADDGPYEAYIWNPSKGEITLEGLVFQVRISR